MASYRGHTISCDTSLVSGVQGAFNNAGATIKSKAAELKSELQALIDYAYSDPTVGTSLSANNVDGAVEAVDEAITTAITQLNNIINSITDYSDGNWTDINNKLFLDNFLGIKNPGSNPSPSPGGPSTPTTSDSGQQPTVTTDEVLESTESTIDANPYIDNQGLNSTDVEIISNQADIVSSDYVAPNGYATTVIGSAGETLESFESDIATGGQAMGELSGSISSLGGKFDFAIPSPTLGGVSEVRSSSIAASTIGLAAAAALAMGGKVLYDKKNEDEDEEENDEQETSDDEKDITETHIETGADVIDESNPEGSNIVRFKEEIFQIGVDEEND